MTYLNIKHKAKEPLIQEKKKARVKRIKVQRYREIT